MNAPGPIGVRDSLCTCAGPGYWVDRTRMNFALQLLLGNAGSPLALVAALGAIALLSEAPRKDRAALACFLAAMTALFKVFVAAQLAVGLLLAGLLTCRLPAWLAPLAPLAITSVALSWGARSGTRITWAPGKQAQSFEASLGILSPWLSVFLWLLVGLGARWVGMRRLVRALASESPARIAIAGLTLAGLLAGSLFVVQTREALHSERIFNQPSTSRPIRVGYRRKCHRAANWIRVARTAGAWTDGLGACAPRPRGPAAFPPIPNPHRSLPGLLTRRPDRAGPELAAGRRRRVGGFSALRLSQPVVELVRDPQRAPEAEGFVVNARARPASRRGGFDRSGFKNAGSSVKGRVPAIDKAATQSGTGLR